MRVKILITIGLGFNILLLCLYHLKISSPSELLASKVPKFEDAPSTHWQNSEPWQSYISDLSLDKLQNNIINDDNYCNKVANHRNANQLEFDPEGHLIEAQRVYYTDYSKHQIPRNELRKQGKLIHLNNRKDSVSGIPIKFDPSIISFYAHYVSWHNFHKIGVHFLCEGQRYNHIPGNVNLNYKDVNVDNIRSYSMHYVQREHCFDPWSVMPYSLNLENSYQCQEFLEELENQESSSEIKWMLKKSRYVHRGRGVYLVDRNLTASLLNTTECPWKEDYIAQRYIQSPLLIHNKKFDFRVYMVIANMDPLMILYRDGFVRLSTEEYNSHSTEKTVHLTNTDLSVEYIKNMNISDDAAQDLLESQALSLVSFEEYLVEQGLVQKGWLDQVVKPAIKQTMFHLVRMTLDKLLKHPGVYELFGVDFMMDSDLHLWYLETTLSPAMVPGNNMKTSVYTSLLRDLLHLELLIQFSIGEMDEFLDSTDFEWIFDGRKKGIARYNNLISEDCL